jgi:hypothetical protein
VKDPGKVYIPRVRTLPKLPRSGTTRDSSLTHCFPYYGNSKKTRLIENLTLNNSSKHEVKFCPQNEVE